MRSAARRAGVELDGSAVTAEVGLDKQDGGFALQVRLAAQLPGVPAATARELLDQAHRACPYSKAIHGNVEVRVDLDAAVPPRPLPN